MRRSFQPKRAVKRPLLQWALALVFLVVWSAAIGVVSLHYAAVAYGGVLFDSYMSHASLLVLNLLPGLVIALLFFALTNRVWPGVLASSVIVLLASIVDCYKLQTRSEPLLASDLKYINEAANISSRYNLVVSKGMILTAAAVVLATIFALLFLKARARTGRGHLAFLLAVILCGTTVYFSVYRSESIYAETEYLDVVLDNGHQLNQWASTDRFICRGFWYPFLYSTGDLGPKKPAGYSDAKAEALLARYPSGDIPEERKVNFISIMLEAYADFSTFEQLEFENDPYAFFHELQQESIHGYLDTNIFAGGTIDTERCYMTGSVEMHEYAITVDSFVRWFRSQGYETQFLHPGYSWFYNRQNVSVYLGFDYACFGGDYFPFFDDTTPIMDNIFMPQIVELLHAANDRGKPCFSMSVTYQNHGPYTGDFIYDADNVFVRQGGMSEVSYNIFNNYLWGINQTDAALRTLVDTLRSEPEPIVLVLFGDHKPWLGDNSSVYTEAGIDLSFATPEGYYNFTRTPYVIWANDAAKETLGSDFVGEGEDFSPCFLMMKLFDECGYTGDEYMNALRDTYGELNLISPALSHYRYGDKLRIHLDQLPASANEKLLNLQILDYYRANHMVG